ncbi:trypsin-like peptidase domain-containing protein [Thiocapsa rosea]|uniref:Serine protease n=1 Tax=Thiocapsa rosea TaxID=69360 RepID=A0A495V4W6_9GAMM|nr:trypsin-like peptidase domain-containing protein [Thiocapsa rosea]RKT44451.1 V8-like Glu-specific endopeptidase [Thiocapsa rosea]
MSSGSESAAQRRSAWTSIGWKLGLLASLVAWQIMTGSAVLAAEQDESSPGWGNIDADLMVVDCPFSAEARPAAARVVLQIIDGELHKWEEHDLGEGRVCLVQVLPDERLLSISHALDLLERSASWTEQEPSFDAMEILSPDDPGLTVPPAVPPSAPTGPLPEPDGIDTDGPPGWPRGDNDDDGTNPYSFAYMDDVVPEVVIGTDDRVRVVTKTQYPWWVIGYQGHTFSDSSSWRCTGFVVGPQMAMTNGHCVYDSARGGYAASMSLAPAQSQASTGAAVVRPYGNESACHWRTNTQYIDTADVQYDYAAMFFRSSWSLKGISTFMPLVFDVSPTTINTAGYPGTAQGASTFDMWRAFDGTNVQVVDRILRYTADTSGGQSGSPVWLLQGENRRVVTVHSFGNATAGYNGGPRLVSQNRAVIENWLANQAAYCPPLTRTVTATAGTGGTVTPTSRTVNQGSTASFTVTANTGYTRNNAVGGTCPAGGWSGNTYTTGAVTANCAVSFSFTAIVGSGMSIGLFNPATSTFYLRNANSSGPANTVFGFGPPGRGWRPLTGDWNGNGQTTVGLYNPVTSSFYLRNANSGGAAEVSFGFGPAGRGWTPLTGDWNGNGRTTVGLYNPAASTFYLRNANSGGAADVSFSFGPGGRGWLPLTGDWNGNGLTTIGLYNPGTSTFYLRNANSGGAADISFGFGPAGRGWLPLTGDWNGNGQTTIGLFNPMTSTFYLRNANSGGAADVVFGFGPGGAGWAALTGKWLP